MAAPTHTPPHIVRFIKFVLATLGALVIGVIAILSVGVYLFDWHGSTTTSALRIVPLPAATISWRPLPYTDYLVQLEALRHYTRTVASATTGIVPDQSESGLRQMTIRKLIREEATLMLLKRYGVAITTQDVTRAYSAQILQTGNQQATTTAIAELYQWTPAQYQRYVVTGAVAREKLREYLSFHAPYNTAAATQAAKVLALVKAGDESFEDLAKKYSEDAYAVNGGDMGIIRRGEQNETIEQAAFQLEPGQVSELLHTKYGYHILQVTDKQEVDGQEQVRAKQIFIAGPSIDDGIRDELKTHTIGVWVKGFRWDAKKSDVVRS